MSRLSLDHALPVGRVGLELAVAGGALALGAARRARSVSGARVVGVAAEDAQRAAVRRQLLDVEQPQAVGGEHALDDREREVREVLVVDRVQLVLVDQPHQVRELDGDDAARREQHLHAADEVVEVGHVGEHVVGGDQVGLAALGEPRRGLDAEERDLGRDALGDRDLGDVGGRLDAEHGHAALGEVLQQVAVVAGELDDLALQPRARSARSSPPRSGARGRASSSSTTRSTRSPRRSRPASRTPRAGRGSSSRRRAPAAGRTAPSRWRAPAARRSWPAATSRGRRRRPRAARRRIGRATGS